MWQLLVLLFATAAHALPELCRDPDPARLTLKDSIFETLKPRNATQVKSFSYTYNDCKSYRVISRLPKIRAQLLVIFNIRFKCYSTHSPLATCGERPFKCGEWLCFQIHFKMGKVSNCNYKYNWKTLNEHPEAQLKFVVRRRIKMPIYLLPKNVAND